ncbi:hypothetical protein JAAARDRAFT_62828 [Jaapia argillacea MUCL 33604]|uniref:NADP-dependent oxidoreductase domain-containing protein n=1 Tax=Jaapia argillacea MUCL 33604 TaxID=933084 RepID=A0A067PKU4_9AGAM|nr:hypothetical protein JAAARDRAFT_62828 [Jaapia argillacea MUCL 33604]
MSAAYTLQSHVEIEPGVYMPRLGFGVGASPTSLCQSSVQFALSTGYRHIDCAMHYGNEKEVGLAIKASKIPRDQIFVTTKILAPLTDDNGVFSEEKIMHSLTEAVEQFGLEYVDLFLIHTPTSGPDGRLKLWEGLEKLKANGRARSIGVSNFGVDHLEQLAAAGKSKPSVNQIEVHPWRQQRDITDYCQKNGILVQAYSPMVRGRKLDDTTLFEISIAHSMERVIDPAQILIRWSLQKGYVPLPKSDTPSRILGNAMVFDFHLAPEEVAALDALDEGETGAIAPNPVNCP